MAPANGCSLERSRLAASCSSLLSLTPCAATIATSWGRPSVKGAVLSSTIVSTRSKRSSASARRIKIPRLAPRPVPTMIDIGVAKPNAHGQAMISTATAFTSACASRGSGPQTPQMTAVTSAESTTAGTNQPDAFTICASKVACPTRLGFASRSCLGR